MFDPIFQFNLLLVSSLLQRSRIRSCNNRTVAVTIEIIIRTVVIIDNSNDNAMINKTMDITTLDTEKSGSLERAKELISQIDHREPKHASIRYTTISSSRFQRVFVANLPLRGSEFTSATRRRDISPRRPWNFEHATAGTTASLAVEINALPLNVVARVVATTLEHRSVHPTSRVASPTTFRPRQTRWRERERRRNAHETSIFLLVPRTLVHTLPEDVTELSTILGDEELRGLLTSRLIPLAPLRRDFTWQTCNDANVSPSSGDVLHLEVFDDYTTAPSFGRSINSTPPENVR